MLQINSSFLYKVCRNVNIIDWSMKAMWRWKVEEILKIWYLLFILGFCISINIIDWSMKAVWRWKVEDIMKIGYLLFILGFCIFFLLKNVWPWHLTRSTTNAFYFNFLEIVDVTPESFLKRIKFIGTWFILLLNFS